MKKKIRVEILGGIASGKTTLAGLFEEEGYSCVFEDFCANPFWLKFCASPLEYCFETEVTFLLQHFSQCKDALKELDLIVCDFSFLQDLAYADINLHGGQYEAFCKVYDEVIATIGLPSLTIHLHCDAETKLSRIKERSRLEEQSISIDYLESLNVAIQNRLSRVQGDVELLTLDSQKIDFANDSDDIRETKSLIEKKMKKLY